MISEFIFTSRLWFFLKAKKNEELEKLDPRSLIFASGW